MAKASVTVKVEGIENMLGNMRRAEDLKPLHPLLVSAAAVARNTSTASAPTFSGRLKGSVVTEISEFESRVSFPVSYARVVEFGRKPSHVSQLRYGLGLQGAPKLPPPNALKAWAIAHGFSNTFVLARAIAKRGAKGRFFRRKGRVAVRKALPGLVEKMSRQMEADWK